METTLYYFSGTGNSLAIAQKIATELTGTTTLIPIPEALNTPCCTTERVGFVFPLYFTGLPEIVTRFMKQLRLSRCRYSFAIVNMGLSFGCAIDQIKKLLKQKGITLNFGEKITMPNNYLMLPIKNSPDSITQKLEKMERRVKKFATIINRGEGRINNDYPVLKQLALLRNHFALKKIQEADRHFHLSGSCSGCGRCKQICPVGNITMAQKPQWHHNCQLCLGCINGCPKKIIQFKKSTLKKERYLHPAFKSPFYRGSQTARLQEKRL